MLLFISAIVISMIITSSLGVLYFDVNMATHEWHVVVLMVIATTVALLIGNLFFVPIIRILPKKWFNPHLKLYITGKHEKRLYQFLHINKWKDKFPDASKYDAGYDKSYVGELTSDNIILFARETVYAEVIHYAGILASVIIPIIYFMVPIYVISGLFWGVILPCAIINIFLNLPFIFIQRHNRPRLMRIYKLLIKKERKTEVCELIGDENESMLNLLEEEPCEPKTI